MRRIVLTALVTLGILVPMTFVPAQRNEGAMGATPPQKPTVLIHITSSDGSVYADPESVIVKRGQKVEWVCEQGDWEVIFTSDEPFGPGPASRRIKGKMGKAHGRPVQNLAKLGAYAYDIQVTLPDGTVVEMDPEIVIERDRGM